MSTRMPIGTTATTLAAKMVPYGTSSAVSVVILAVIGLANLLTATVVALAVATAAALLLARRATRISDSACLRSPTRGVTSRAPTSMTK